MVCGYFFVCHRTLWQSIVEKRRTLLIIACFTILFITLDRNGAFPWMAEAFKNNFEVRVAYGFVLVTNLWCWLLVMVGYAGRYLNKKSRLLTYANDAVLPWYMLHQTLIILFAVGLSGFALHAGVESILLVIATMLGCVLGYEVVKRINVLRLLFGIKINHGEGLSATEKRRYTGQTVGE